MCEVEAMELPIKAPQQRPRVLRRQVVAKALRVHHRYASLQRLHRRWQVAPVETVRMLCVCVLQRDWGGERERERETETERERERERASDCARECVWCDTHEGKDTIDLKLKSPATSVGTRSSAPTMRRMSASMLARCCANTDGVAAAASTFDPSWIKWRLTKVNVLCGKMEGCLRRVECSVHAWESRVTCDVVPTRVQTQSTHAPETTTAETSARSAESAGVLTYASEETER